MLSWMSPEVCGVNMDAAFPRAAADRLLKQRGRTPAGADRQVRPVRKRTDGRHEKEREDWCFLVVCKLVIRIISCNAPDEGGDRVTVGIAAFG